MGAPLRETKPGMWLGEGGSVLLAHLGQVLQDGAIRTLIPLGSSTPVVRASRSDGVHGQATFTGMSDEAQRVDLDRRLLSVTSFRAGAASTPTSLQCRIIFADTPQTVATSPMSNIATGLSWLRWPTRASVPTKCG
jgi:hypothetical protein